MTDKWDGAMPGLSAPISSMLVAQDTDMTNITRAIYVGTAGAVKLTLADDTVITITLTAGWHPIRAKRVWATGTTPSTTTYGAW